MFPGFNNKKRSSVSSGDWDRDGVKNRRDCEPLNRLKQGREHYWDQHSDELLTALNQLYPGERYHEIDDSQERKVKRLAAKIIKQGREY